jgi:pimeloyl-ACP methyl ester carboxylesterase
LIHGQVFDSTVWNEVLPSLAARVLLPDMPGLGASCDELVVDFPLAQSRLEEALLSRTSGPVHLVGYSLGSYHALALTLKGKLRVKSLMMLGPWPGADQPVLDSFAAYEPAVRAGQVSWVDVFLANCFSAEFAVAHPATVARTRAQIAAGSIHALLSEFAFFPRMPDLRPRLAEVKVPFLVRVGEKDPSTPAAVGAAMKQLAPQLQLEIVPGVALHAHGPSSLRGGCQGIAAV